MMGDGNHKGIVISRVVRVEMGTDKDVDILRTQAKIGKAYGGMTCGSSPTKQSQTTPPTPPDTPPPTVTSAPPCSRVSS